MATTPEKNVKVPKYVQLADQLRQQIVNGELPPHHPLLSFTEMKARFGATQWTVEKAHSILEEDGLIRREPRRGLFVNDPTLRVKTDFVAFIDEKGARELPYHREIERGIRLQAEALGKYITLVHTPTRFKHWKSMDGIILDKFGLFQDDEFVHLCPSEIPVVRLHYPEEGTSCVMADDAAGIYMAVDYLYELGHRRIGFLYRRRPAEHGPDDISTTKIRSDAYHAALASHDIVPHPAWTSYYGIDFYYDLDKGYHDMRKWLQEGWSELGITALLAQNDYTALGMIRALAEQGIRVPEDVSIVGFDGIDSSVSSSIELTTIVVPLREIGATAMKLLLNHVNHPHRKPEIVTLPVRLHLGGTSGPPPQD